MDIRPMRPSDLSEVAQIERETFADPWSPENFLSDLDNPAVLSRVAEENGLVLGYLVVWVFKEVLHIANIALVSDQRGQGLGSRLLRHTIEFARDRKIDRIELEVRESNDAAIRFYERQGFRHVRTVKGYYERGPEDARVYRLDL
jgi:ribosomal-protein-alanine acetyltransferase